MRSSCAEGRLFYQRWYLHFLNYVQKKIYFLYYTGVLDDKWLVTTAFVSLNGMHVFVITLYWLVSCGRRFMRNERQTRAVITVYCLPTAANNNSLSRIAGSVYSLDMYIMAPLMRCLALPLPYGQQCHILLYCQLLAFFLIKSNYH